MTYEYADITSVSPPEPLADWEREFLARQWVREHGDDEVRWLVEHMDQDRKRSEELLREAAELETLFEQRDHAIAEALVWRKRNADLAAENARLRERQQRVIELHTDSVAGVCPSCGRIGEQSDEDDGLVPWPCPTVLVLNPRAGVS